MFKTLTILFFVFCCINDAQAQNIKKFLAFDGEDDYVSIIDTLTTQPQLKINDNLTVDTWIYFKSFEKPMTIISMGQIQVSTEKKQLLYCMTMNADKSVRFEWETNNGVDVIINSSPFNIKEKQWYHIAVTRDVKEAIVSFYLDGKKVGNYAFNPKEQPYGGQIGHCTLGARITEKGAVYFPFKGMFDKIRVWNVVLPETRIRSYSNINFIGFEPELVASYQFSDGKCNDDNNQENTHLFDYTEHHNHGILYNFQLKGKDSNWICW